MKAHEKSSYSILWGLTGMEEEKTKRSGLEQIDGLNAER